WGGPETLLHGDLWSINVFVIPTAHGPRVRLIDWDHASVGPASYDLSTFLLRLPSQERSWVLEVYREEMSRAGWGLPPMPILKILPLCWRAKPKCWTRNLENPGLAAA